MSGVGLYFAGMMRVVLHRTWIVVHFVGKTLTRNSDAANSAAALPGVTAEGLGRSEFVQLEHYCRLTSCAVNPFT